MYNIICEDGKICYRNDRENKIPFIAIIELMADL